MTAEQVQAFLASYTQSRLWFLHQLDPNLTAYHIPRVWSLKGVLELKALEGALADLIERHATLRTSFRLHDGDVLQLIHLPGEFALAVEELGERDREEVIEQWLEQERSTPFDLSSGRLLRARLLVVDKQHHMLLLNHHHIASDGWSQSVLARDLTELYNARRSGRVSELAPLRVHYYDYAAWQRQRLSGHFLQTLKDYWIPQLTGLEPLELPADHPRPATPSHQGGSVSIRIAAELVGRFEDLCRLEGATLQMGLLAMVALLLHRYSRQDDFAIGVPIWGRNHPDLEPLIGFFINTLPIRIRLTPQESFRQVLQQVKDSSLAAYDHQELPFEQMVEALNLPRDTSRNPLVQVMLQLIELPEDSLHQLEGLAVEVMPLKGESSKLDLSFYLRRSADHGLQGSIAYATDLFSSDRMERLCSHLLTLLSSILEAPDSPADSLCLLPDAERQLIESWQHGPTIDVPDLCVHQLFEQQVERTPDAIALIFEDQQLTYQELNARANQLAHHLIRLGVGPEVIVAVCLERSVELIVSLLAILKAGGAYLPIDPSWPEKRQQQLLRASRTPLLINDQTNTTHGSPNAGPRILHLSNLSASGQPTEINPQRARPDALAYLLFTSGSTGTPKGVLVEHQAVTTRLAGLQALLPLCPDTKVIAVTAVTFDISILELILSLASGAIVVLANERQHRDPVAIRELVLQHEINLIQATPSLLHELLNRGGSFVTDLTIIAGGESLPPVWAKQLCQISSHVVNGYGPTEATIYTSLAQIRGSTAVTIGRPIAASIVRILNGAGHPCPIGIPGELHIGGDGLARDYLNNPKLTAEKFIGDPFSTDSTDRLYKSGDLASWNPDGTLAFHGRIDQQIKLRGFRIEPGEIEANLLAHPAIAQAVVLLRNDDPDTPRLIAYWVRDTSQPPTEAVSSEKLRAYLADRLPDYMVPAAFLQLEALPLTTNGKLDRKALPAPSFSGNLEQRVAPSTHLERQLHAIWAKALGHTDFGVTDNFFLIGGNSLTLAQVRDQIEKLIDKPILLPSLFSNQCIRSLAGSLNTTSIPILDYASSTLRTANPQHISSTLLRRFESNQAKLISRWPGIASHGHQYVRTLYPDSRLRPMFWCFQAAHEFQGLAEDLSSISRVSGMRSGHLTDVDIYSNPALLHQIAQLYFQEIIELQPTGPYCIGGNCQGAILANAIAWQLVAHGAEVKPLIMMETSLKSILDFGIRWNGALALLYGKESRMNPFRHHNIPNKASGEGGSNLDRVVSSSPTDILKRVFSGPFSITEIEGSHGTFFNNHNRQSLSKVITTLLSS